MVPRLLPLSRLALLALFRHGCMTREQLAVVLRCHPNSLWRVLSKLRRDRFVKSVPVGRCPMSLLWVPTVLGSTAALKLIGDAGTEPDKRLLQRTEGVASQIAEHEYETAQTLVALVRGSAPPMHGVVDWQASWLAARVFCTEILGVRGVARVARYEVLPDASGAYAFRSGIVRFFVETDVGTEDLGRVADKARRYVRALLRRRRAAPWAILVTCPSPRRVANVAEAMGAVLDVGDEDVARFLVASRSDLAKAGPLAPVWEDAQTGERVRLEDLPLWPLEREYSVEDGDFVGFPPRAAVARDAAGRFARGLGESGVSG